MLTNQSSQKSLWPYLMWLFALSIPFWILGGLIDTTEFPINLPVSALMAFNPMIVALILVYREQGIDGVRALLKRIVDVRRIQNRWWLLPVFLLMPLLMVLTYGLLLLSGQRVPDPQVPLLMTPVLFAAFFIAAIGEEGGWQGYAFDVLTTRWNAIPTAVMLGVVWAVWHVIPFFQTGNTAWWVFWQCVVTVGLRVLIVWLYMHTGQSLFAAISFHAMINVSNFLFPNYGSHYDPFFASIATLAVVALIVISWRPAQSKIQTTQSLQEK